MSEKHTAVSTTVLQEPKQISDNESYLCPFCGFIVNLYGEFRSDKDWQEHIYRDLFTYLCTFDDCKQSRKVYGDKDEWYYHELSTHRIPMVWLCGECQDEFSTRSKLEEHILLAHADDFTVSEVSRLICFIRPSRSRKAALGRISCPLCPSTLDLDSAKEHIAGHLETFSRAFLDRQTVTSSSDLSNIVTQGERNEFDETGVKLRLLEAFATEQHFRTSTNYPDHAHITEEDDLVDVSDEEDSEDSEQDTTVSMSTRAWRVRSLMETSDDQNRRHLRTKSSSEANAKLQLDTRIFPRDGNFRGREKDLTNLYTILSDPGKVYILSAEGGMGKTALAVEFTYRFEHVFEGVFWVQAETHVGATETFNQIATAVGLARTGDDQQTLTRKGRHYLESTTKRWLLVLDNVETWEHIDMFTPSTTSATTGSILITTRHQHFTAPSRPVNYYRKTLGELSVDDGADLLLQGLPAELRPKSRIAREDAEMKAVKDIARLAGIPLAIIIIAGYMKSLNCCPSEFWSYWNSWWLANRPDLKASVIQGRVEQVMKLSLEDLDDETLSVILIMTFFSSHGAQKELLTWDHSPSKYEYLRPTR